MMPDAKVTPTVLFKPLMPLGVEHNHARLGGVAMPGLFKPLMPLGVEHFRVPTGKSASISFV